MIGTLEPTKKVWTEAELAALPDDGYIHEVVDGELVMSPKNNFRHGDICVRISMALGQFAKSRRLGAVCDSSTGFWMQNRNCRAPDVSFISKERLKGKRRADNAFFQGAPDLAIEVLSPDNTPGEISRRLKDFFSSGTRLAWIINPEKECAEVCHSPTERRLVGPGGVLDGEEVVPGFQLSLTELFKDWEWD
ncbi:MAG TPA: Uma2 family endonuclease [Methylomirabilota bacterium]|nr:Uma2 family endonuclease [Methylomirabilota bacterium]